MKYLKNSQLYCAVAALLFSLSVHAVQQQSAEQLFEAQNKQIVEITEATRTLLRQAVKNVSSQAFQKWYKKADQQTKKLYSDLFEVSEVLLELWEITIFKSALDPAYNKKLKLDSKCSPDNPSFGSGHFFFLPDQNQETSKPELYGFFCPQAFSELIQGRYEGNLKAVSQAVLAVGITSIKEWVNLGECEVFFLIKGIVGLAGSQLENVTAFQSREERCREVAPPTKSVAPVTGSRIAEEF